MLIVSINEGICRGKFSLTHKARGISNNRMALGLFLGSRMPWARCLGYLNVLIKISQLAKTAVNRYFHAVRATSDQVTDLTY